MRVVEVTRTWPAETFVCRHIDALFHVKHLDLSIFALSCRPSQSATVDPSSCSHYSVKQLPTFYNTSILTKLRFAAQSMLFRPPPGAWRISQRAIMQAIEQAQPDLLHFHSGHVAVQLARYAIALGVPYTLSIRGSDIQVRPLTDTQYAASLEQALAAAERIHVVCDALGEVVLRIRPSLNNIETIRTCIPIPEDVQVVYKTSNPLSFISVGRLHWRKAYDVLIHAMVFMPEATLTIVGEGPDREHLLYLIKALKLEQRVHLVGRLPYNELFALLCNANAYVQTSIAEGFSNALAEAMACGKLVFATDVGGTSEVISNGVNGFLLPTADPAGTAQQLELARNPDVRRKLGQAARKTSLEQFTAEQHAAQFVKFFETAVNAHG